MKSLGLSRCALSIGAAALLLAGCGGSQPPIGAPGAMSQSASRPGATVHYIYVTNDGSANVSAFAINANTGTLTQANGSPFAAGPEPWGVAVDPTGKFAYVTNVTDAAAEVAHPTTITSRNSGSVSAYAINVRSGALTQVNGSPFTSGGIEPWEMAISPSGKFAYVTNFYSDNVSAYAIDAKSGALTPVQGSPFGTRTDPGGVAVDPTGRFAYVANGGSGSVSAYAIKRSGALAQVKGSPFAAGTYPWGVAVDPSDKFAYVSNYSSGNVSAYRINPKSGGLTQVQGSPFAAGSGSFGVAVDPAGPFLYVVNERSDDVSAYVINPSDGVLTPVPGSPFAAGTDPYGVAINPSGKFAYVANAYWGSAFGNISAYEIKRNGALMQVKGSPFAGGSGPVGLAIR